MQIVETIKNHPYASAGVVFVIGAAIVIYMRSGGSSAPTPSGAYLDNSSAVAAGTQLQQAQLAADAHSQDLQSQLTAQQNTNSTNLSIAQIAAQVQINSQDVQADTINQKTAADVSINKYHYDAENYANQLVATTQQNANTLAAQTTQQGQQLSAATTQQAQQLAATTSQQATALAAQVQEASYAAQTQQETLVANAYQNAAYINQQTQEYTAHESATTQQALIEANKQTEIARQGSALEQAKLTAANTAEAQKQSFLLNEWALSKSSSWW